MPFRGEIVGIDALSQTLFGKRASGLDAQEAAVAAALVRAPNAKAAAVAERACGVLRLQRLDCTGVVGLTESSLARRGGMPLGEQLAPHFARQAIDPRGPALQSGTLDAALQRLATLTLRRQLAELTGRNVEDGAVVVLDNASGEVLAWVGSNARSSAAAEVDGVLARRQPGSTLKPFVYELAFEKRLLTPASLLDDSPAQIATANGLYLPQNYDREWKGFVSARTALGASLNVPAVRVAGLLGPDALHQRLRRFGFELPESAGWYGASLALGSADVSLLALSNAYRTLANGGLASPALLKRGGAAARPVRVADAAAVHLVTDILADNNARARTFGLASALATRGFAAVKTGTSKDLRDNWCVGFTDRYTIGVWVGNAGGEAMHDVSGISGAAPVWHALVAALHAGAVSKAPPPPAGVTRLRIAFDSGKEPTRDEVFLAGSERALQRATAEVGGARRFGITSPRDGSVFALDPDIPPAAQRITFEGEHGKWVLDGRPLGSADALALGALARSASAGARRQRRPRAAERGLRGARCGGSSGPVDSSARPIRLSSSHAQARARRFRPVPARRDRSGAEPPGRATRRHRGSDPGRRHHRVPAAERPAGPAGSRRLQAEHHRQRHLPGRLAPRELRRDRHGAPARAPAVQGHADAIATSGASSPSGACAPTARPGTTAPTTSPPSRPATRTSAGTSAGRPTR